MLVSDILQKLPASLEWMVLFNLQPLRTLATDTVIKGMFFLPAETDLDAFSHVILTSEGRCLAPQTGLDLLMAQDQLAPAAWLTPSEPLSERYQPQLRLFTIDEADCLGLGQTASYPPVLLFAQVKAGCAEAKAIFQYAPNQRHYELLTAVGVQFKGGSYQGDYYVAEFTNQLPTHIHAGILAHFTRTQHCNQFFLQHGQIDPPLATGLALAAKDRVAWARDRSFEAVSQLALRASQESLAMTCQPPPPAPAYPFGDLVPLGFALKALAQGGCADASQSVQQLLLSRRQARLWAFHTGRLVTATDSALVLQGFVELDSPAFSIADFAAAVADLEIFADGQGGYYPQLFTEQAGNGSTAEQPGRMRLEEVNRHWGQADYATTCLVRGLRQVAGLPEKTPLDYLEAGFETRSGLYFANPYLVDYALAQTIKADESAAELRARLLAEILGSMNKDYTFGRYDVALSSALAVLCLALLGYRGRTMRLAQLRLLDFMEAEGRWPGSTPFYSTFKFDHTRLPAQTLFGLLLNNQTQQILQVEGQYHAVSLYRDTHQIISTALAGLALAEKCVSASHDPAIKLPLTSGSHPRYDCAHHPAYIAQFALPPYLNSKKGIYS